MGRTSAYHLADSNARMWQLSSGKRVSQPPTAAYLTDPATGAPCTVRRVDVYKLLSTPGNQPQEHQRQRREVTTTRRCNMPQKVRLALVAGL